MSEKMMKFVKVKQSSPEKISNEVRKNDFKEIQLNKCKELCLQINSAYSNNITFHGHCEVASGKDCPVFDYKKLLNLNQQGYIVL